jgi:hypothetical protein
MIVRHITFVIENRERGSQKLVANRARKRKKRAAFFTTRLLGLRLDFVAALTAIHECHQAIFLPRQTPAVISKR